MVEIIILSGFIGLIAAAISAMMQNNQADITEDEWNEAHFFHNGERWLSKKEWKEGGWKW